MSDAGGGEDPFESIEHVLAFSSKDWSNDRRDAWIYGVVCGWDDAALETLAKKHDWPPEAVGRLKRLHAAWRRHKDAACAAPVRSRQAAEDGNGMRDAKEQVSAILRSRPQPKREETAPVQNIQSSDSGGLGHSQGPQAADAIDGGEKIAPDSAVAEDPRRGRISDASTAVLGHSQQAPEESGARCEEAEGYLHRGELIPPSLGRDLVRLLRANVRSEHSETEERLRACVAALVRCGHRLWDVAEHPESCSLQEHGPGCCDCGLEEAQERWRWVVYEVEEHGGVRLLANARNAQEKQPEEPKREKPKSPPSTGWYCGLGHHNMDFDEECSQCSEEPQR